NVSDQTSGRQFSLFALSGLGLVLGALVLALNLIPHVSGFAGVVLAEFVHACSQLIAGLTGKDVILSSINIALLGAISVFFLVAVILLAVTFIRTANYIRLLRSKTGKNTSIRLQKITERVKFPILEINDSHSYVVSAGFLHPTIYISRGMMEMLNDGELLGVLLHEEHHCIKRDTSRLLIVHFFAKVFWFIPGITKFAEYIKTLFEISADEAAIRQQGTDHFLGRALVKALKVRETTIPATIPAFSAINDRIERIINRQFSPHTQVAVIIPLVALLFFMGSIFFSRTISAAPQMPADGTAARLISQSTVCPGIIPQLLLSMPENKTCITDASGYVMTCEEVQSKAQ
ncbi:MAG: M56 family metallopeptidase, partial [Parcubacteria group bacterium]